jgi:hypothetical protein
MNIFKTPLNSFYLTFKLHHHEELKIKLLSLINNQNSESLEIKDLYYGDKISKLDWNDANNFNRPWVSLLLPKLQSQLNTVCQACGYQTALINELWFQQYTENDSHGWHVHGSNFTGVYYLDMPDGSPTTQLVTPLYQNEVITPDIREGYILIFPSFVIHRAPPIQQNLKKTIISFNCDFDMVRSDLLETFNLLMENNCGRK